MEQKLCFILAVCPVPTTVTGKELALKTQGKESVKSQMLLFVKKERDRNQMSLG